MNNALPITLIDLTKRFGREVVGVDVCAAAGTDEFNAFLRKSLFESRLLVFKGQNRVSANELLLLAGAIGSAAPSADARFQLAGFPKISVVGQNAAPDQQSAMFVNGEIEWHYDYAQYETPALAGILFGVQIPAYGGDTIFCDTRSAYEMLSKGDQEKADKMFATFSVEKLNQLLVDLHAANRAEGAPSHPPVTRAVVPVHPITGRRSIQLAPELMTPVPPCSKDEMVSLLNYCTAEDFLYRHKWSVGDILIYDNLSMIHTATPLQNPLDTRILYRATIL